MRSEAYYWLHLVPLLVAMGLAILLILASALLSLPARRRGTWLPRLLTGLFGGLLFISPPFRELAYPLRLGQMSWASLENSAGVLLRDRLDLGSALSAWLPGFLAGFLVFALGRMLFDRFVR